MVRTPPCFLVTVDESFGLPVTPIEGKEPPLAPIEAVATSPQPTTESLPLWLAPPEPLEPCLVP